MMRAFGIVVKTALVLILMFASNHGLLERFGYFITARRYALGSAYGTIWLCALMAVLYSALTPRLLCRMFWGVLIVLAGFLADAYFSIMKLHYNIDSAEALWNMRFWAGDVITSFRDLMLWPTIRALALLGLCITPPVLQQLKARRLVLTPLVPILFSMVIIVGTGGYGMAGLPGQFSTISLAGMFALYDLGIGEREAVTIKKTSALAIQHIVLIIDEGIRGDFVNFSDATTATPYLKSIREQIIDFGITSAGNNCSQASNALLRMGANPRSLGVRGENIMKNPSIWKYARAAGYETTFLDAQANNGILINYMNPDEKSLIDHFIQIDMPVAYYNDREAARIIQSRLTAKKPQFIYLNKRGVHFHYEYFYPNGSRTFYPCLAAGEVTRDRTKLINSYKNAIQWAVDGFFQTLLSNAPDLGNAVVIYTADHGQNLLEDVDPVTHCREKPTRQEAMVPLLVMTGNRPLFEKFKEAAEINKNRANHFQIFPTILELFGFSPAEIKESYYVTLFDRVPERLGFTSGAVFGRFGKTPKWTPLPEDIARCCDKQ
jgi:hypothetical protein